MTGKVLLKDLLFNPVKVEQLAAELASVHPSFAAERFVHDVTARLPELELKSRIGWIASCLAGHLPADYREAVAVILAALPPPNDPTLSDGDFGDFIHAPYAEYVARQGLAREDLELSLEALRQITMRFSAEDALRAFIDRHPDETLLVLKQWTRDEHYHVRRLCSEGTRPLLPWSRRLVTPPTYGVELLEVLHTDRTRFVTRSVANHVNDLSKLDPDLAVGLLTSWRNAGAQEPRELDFIVRHAARTLVKRGYGPALELVQVTPSVEVTIIDAEVPVAVTLGDSLRFSVTLQAARDADVVVGYRLRFPSPNGRGLRQRTYALKRIRMVAGTPVTVGKGHRLRVGMTTLPLHPGTHELAVLVNGQPIRSWSVEFTEGPPS